MQKGCPLSLRPRPSHLQQPLCALQVEASFEEAFAALFGALPILSALHLGPAVTDGDLEHVHLLGPHAALIQRLNLSVCHKVTDYRFVEVPRCLTALLQLQLSGVSCIGLNLPGLVLSPQLQQLDIGGTRVTGHVLGLLLESLPCSERQALPPPVDHLPRKVAQRFSRGSGGRGLRRGSPPPR